MPPAGAVSSSGSPRAATIVVAPANHLRSIKTDAESIASLLATIDGPIVLVGHSYGGAVITTQRAAAQT